MSDEPYNKRLERLRKDVEGSPFVAWPIWSLEDARWLLDALEERDKQLNATHSAVNESARNWREIGYRDGYSTGYDQAMKDMA